MVSLRGFKGFSPNENLAAVTTAVDATLVQGSDLYAPTPNTLFLSKLYTPKPSPP